MILGLVFSGRMKTLNDQWIETQFFTIGIPLIPIKSMFVTKSEYKNRQGLDIGLHGKSILKGYFSFFTLALGVFMTLAGNAIFYSSFASLIGLLLLGASGYFFFVFGKSTEKENADRVLFQKVVGINALPEYLDEESAENLRDHLVKRLKEAYNDKNLNWIEMVERKQYDEKSLPILFAAMGYHSVTQEDEKYTKLYDKLREEYRKQESQVTK